MIVILLGGVLGLVWYTWQDMTGTLAIRRAEAAASQAAAEANLARNRADAALAEGARALAMGEADAIRAPAEAAGRAVDRQSALILYWGLLGPFGILFTLLSIGVGAFTLGAACVGIGLLVVVYRGGRDVISAR